MTSHQNGSPIPPQPQQAFNPKGMDGRKLVDHCKGVLIVFARGMFSLLAYLQFEGVLVCMAQACGEMLAEACWCNDPIHTIKLRGKVKDALEHGMKLVPSIAPAQPGQMPQNNAETRQ